MPRPLLIALLISTLPPAAFAQTEAAPTPPSAPPTLAERWEREKAQPEPLKPEPGSALEALRGRSALWVAGFMNEGIAGYFGANMEVAEAELGLSNLLYSPDSTQDITVSSHWIQDYVRTEYARTGKPVLLVGHSKGGAEILHAVLSQPGLILQGLVDRVVVIQGALGGSPVADGILGSPVIGFLTGLFLDEGIESLKPDRMKETFAALRNRIVATRDAFEIQELSSRILYVRALSRHNDTISALRGTHTYLAGFGDRVNDGLLLAEDQLLPGIGTDLGVLHADHGGLTCPRPYGIFDADARKAFTRALFKKVYEPAQAPGLRLAPDAVSATTWRIMRWHLEQAGALQERP